MSTSTSETPENTGNIINNTIDLLHEILFQRIRVTFNIQYGVGITVRIIAKRNVTIIIIIHIYYKI